MFKLPGSRANSFDLDIRFRLRDPKALLGASPSISALVSRSTGSYMTIGIMCANAYSRKREGITSGLLRSLFEVVLRCWSL